MRSVWPSRQRCQPPKRLAPPAWGSLANVPAMLPLPLLCAAGFSMSDVAEKTGGGSPGGAEASQQQGQLPPQDGRYHYTESGGADVKAEAEEQVEESWASLEAGGEEPEPVVMPAAAGSSPRAQVGSGAMLRQHLHWLLPPGGSSPEHS